MDKLNLKKPIIGVNGAPARIVCTNRVSEIGTNIVVLELYQGRETVTYVDAWGRIATGRTKYKNISEKKTFTQWFAVYRDTHMAGQKLEAHPVKESLAKWYKSKGFNVFSKEITYEA